MKIIKHSGLYLFFVIECTVFIGMYYFGPNGYKQLVKLQKENNIVRSK